VVVWAESARLPCLGGDLSADGIALTGGWSVYAGREVELEFNLFGHTIYAVGIVAWCRHGPIARWGIRFRDIEAADRERVAAFVASRRHADAANLGSAVGGLHVAPIPPPPPFAGSRELGVDPTIRVMAV
jgi:hypothetical protein